MFRSQDISIFLFFLNPENPKTVTSVTLLHN